MRATDRSRFERLDATAARLKDDAGLTAKDLAEQLGVSLRTVSRDLALLRDRGVPVEADRGRGGGVRLPRNWGVGKLSLTYREAVELLVCLAIAEQLPSPWLIANLAAVRRKLVASFAPSLKDKIAGLRSRILIGGSASAAVVESFSPLGAEITEALLTGFLEQKRVRLSYRDVEGRLTGREIEPQWLLLNAPVWYVMGWDYKREAVRSFRCDRILEAHLSETPFTLRPARDFDEAIADIRAIRP
ncbi:helix-turn-helix transcriptional regulator [Rhizobium sp. TRM95796]|uniref:helix-turn-helix transcriptional regulator n=1 Tax=Rhizobium sp. TRM95796 TaxID=2979862 RepID=UPI0021E8CC57|nr:WYL domain-containing protein [Rhizobium sp. TRM95796]MCV3767474.1 WYL domain-containing protein [Rhizobium sp. TRM95796]